MTGAAGSGRDSPAAAVTEPARSAVAGPPPSRPVGRQLRLGPARPRSAAARARPGPGRVSLRAPATSPRPEQRHRAAARQVSGGFVPEPGVLGCPASPAQPRYRRSRGAGRSRGLPVPLGAGGSAPGPGHGAAARSGGARPEPPPPERDLLRLHHAGSSAALAPGLLRPRRTGGCSGHREAPAAGHCRCGLGFHSRGAPHPTQSAQVLCLRGQQRLARRRKGSNALSASCVFSF
nr:translation initiation factor IF-2-like [Taeniopygia guttata]